MKRVLLDQGLPPGAVVLLRQAGWDAVHVREIGLAAASDPEIMDRADGEQRVCVTLDQDFHSYLAGSGRARPSVILIRAQGLDARGVCELLVRVWEQFANAIAEGAAVSAGRASIRVRRLPLRSTAW